MYVGTYVCMYVCMCVCMYMSMYTFDILFFHVYIRVHVQEAQHRRSAFMFSAVYVCIKLPDLGGARFIPGDSNIR